MIKYGNNLGENSKRWNLEKTETKAQNQTKHFTILEIVKMLNTVNLRLNTKYR